MEENLGRSFETEYHAPVMLHEVLDALSGRAEVLDCTLGGGGHSAALIQAGSNVIAIDRDPDALKTARKRLAWAEQAGRFRAVRGDFTHIDEIPEIEGVPFDGILADLGVSSHQIDAPERGFSFREGVPLDMRMSGTGESAADLLATLSEEDLARLLRDYADEPKARRLAAELARRRANRPFLVSDDLVGAIRAVLGPRSGPGDFARIFQALRIAVNDELAGLERALPLLRDRLRPNGVLAIIAYHSGEDRLVKHAMREWSTACTCPPRQPLCTCGGTAKGALVNRKAIVASAEESARNPRARSAKLRLWRKAA